LVVVVVVVPVVVIPPVPPVAVVVVPVPPVPPVPPVAVVVPEVPAVPAVPLVPPPLLQAAAAATRRAIALPMISFRVKVFIVSSCSSQSNAAPERGHEIVRSPGERRGWQQGLADGRRGAREPSDRAGALR
jgi:hypothetical protein